MVLLARPFPSSGAPADGCPPRLLLPVCWAPECSQVTFTVFPQAPRASGSVLGHQASLLTAARVWGVGPASLLKLK